MSKWSIIRFSKLELIRHWWCVSETDAHRWLFATDTRMCTTEENLNGSLPRVLMSDLEVRPQETDRPETRHYVIVTSECCPVLC